MVSRLAVAAITVACLLVAPAGAVAKPHGSFTPGAPGIGDPYFPLDGNGGYDVARYLLDFRYDPAVGVLHARETIRARATQNLSSFNLDFHTLDIDTIYVDGRSATWTRDGDELTVTPRRPLHKGERFTTVLLYDGVPDPLPDGPGWLQTDDGVLVAGEPHGASTYFAVNDHPLDKASYTFRITAPAGVEAVANGLLDSRRTHRGWTTWVWEAKEPMASYLATVDIGQFDLRFSRAGRVRIIDAVDPDLYNRVQPRTGSQFALSQSANLSYKRLTHVVNVPAAGASMSFWVTRDTELNWDYFFVEAHTVGADDWTTLPDVNGHTSTDTGFVCPLSLELHPFLAHYQTDNGDGTCSPTGTAGGTWNAASGQSDGYEQWKVDLSGYAGKQVEVSLGYASDDIFNFGGVFVDDVAVSTGEGTTSFEDDGDPLDGWTVPGAPRDSAPNDNDWIVGTEADQPQTTGEIADAALAKEPAIIAFLEGLYGRYPWQSSGAIIDDMPGLGFALETQGRPVYAFDFFADRPGAEEADSVIVHELAHQWVGDSLAVAAWRHIWLNEGFATYTEWLYAEDQGRVSAQDQFDSFASIPADAPFWQVVIGDPGPDQLLDIAIYWRGAMTLHALRGRIGDHAFFKLLRTWTTRNAGRNVTIPEFIALAERISRQDLGAFFDEWLFTAGKPASLGATARASRTVAASLRSEAAARLRAFAHARP